MKEYLVKLYQYNAWANRKVIACLEQQRVVDEKIMSVFGHLLSAQFIWLSRIKGWPKSEFQLWGKYTTAELHSMVEESADLWLDHLRENDNFNRALKYTNFVGDYYENNVSDIMIHLVNHGTYHRGQLALLLRQKGFEPVNTDLITYERVLSGQLKD